MCRHGSDDAGTQTDRWYDDKASGLLVCSTLLSRAYGTGCSAANSIEFNGYSIWQVMAERVRAPA